MGERNELLLLSLWILITLTNVGFIVSSLFAAGADQPTLSCQVATALNSTTLLGSTSSSANPETIVKGFANFSWFLICVMVVMFQFLGNSVIKNRRSLFALGFFTGAVLFMLHLMVIMTALLVSIINIKKNANLIREYIALTFCIMEIAELGVMLVLLMRKKEPTSDDNPNMTTKPESPHDAEIVSI